MRYQASVSAEPRAKEDFDRIMQDSAKAAEAVLEFLEENTADTRRKGLINWAQWTSKYGKRTAAESHVQTKPFEKQEFVLREMRKFGRTDAGAKSKWNQYESENYVRDYKGEDGQLRLWLPSKHFKDSVEESYIEHGTTEGSDVRKQVTDEQRDTLRRHVHEAVGSLGHEFFRGRSTLASQGGARPQPQ